VFAIEKYLTIHKKGGYIMSDMYGKVARVMITPDDNEKGITMADVLCDIEGDEDVIRFPCAKEKIGGIYFQKTTKKQKRGQKIKIVRMSLAEYIKEVEKMGCEKIIFEDEFKMEVMEV